MGGTLGAVLAGGASRRFGSDKALAQLEGRPLLDHALAALAPHVDALLVCGRRWPRRNCVADRPGPGLGPLAGINAALHWGAANGYDWVVTSACDIPMLPSDLGRLLAQTGAPGFAEGLPVVGRWPTAARRDLDALLAGGGDRSIRRLACIIGAVPVALPTLPANVNTRADLARLTESRA